MQTLQIRNAGQRESAIKTGSTASRVAERLARGRCFAATSVDEVVKGGTRKTLAVATKSPKSGLLFDNAPVVPPVRTSQVLREILTKNPKVKNFTVQQIIDAIGESRVEASLMFFSIPGMLPVPGTSSLVGLPAGLIAGHMIVGKTEIKLPQFILRRSVPRRSLSLAIHAILPVLEKMEKVVKPRQQWASHPAAHRILGVFIFLLALAIAIPDLGLNVPHAVAIFIISLGLVERDGLAILSGVVAGLAALVLLTGAGISVEGLRLLTGGWVKKLVQKIGFKWAARVGLKWSRRLLKKLGFQWTTLLLLEWAELMLLWDPQAPKKHALKEQRKGSTVRRSQKLAHSSARRSHLHLAERSAVAKRFAI